MNAGAVEGVGCILDRRSSQRSYYDVIVAQHIEIDTTRNTNASVGAKGPFQKFFAALAFLYTDNWPWRIKMS